MGCCCNKEKNEEDEQREPLLSSDSAHNKSRFDQSSQNQTYNSMIASTSNGYDTNLNTETNAKNINTPGGGAGNSNNLHAAADTENTQIFDNILRGVIHVSTVEPQRVTNTTTTNLNDQGMQDLPIKIKGLLEPNKSQLVDFNNIGVIAPMSVLAAQPPFLNDIKLINNFASEANKCIDNYTLDVPTNVAFNFSS